MRIAGPLFLRSNAEPSCGDPLGYSVFVQKSFRSIRAPARNKAREGDLLADGLTSEFSGFSLCDPAARRSLVSGCRGNAGDGVRETLAAAGCQNPGRGQ